MPRIALLAAPSQMNGFVTIKRVKDYFLWYKIQVDKNDATAGLEQLKQLNQIHRAFTNQYP